MKVGANACVIGNPSVGIHARVGVESDVGKVIKFLADRGVAIVNKDTALALTASDMQHTFGRFVEAIGEGDSIALFYFCGHALESREPKDILLLGQDAVDGKLSEHSMSLLASLKQLAAKRRALKLVVIDGCRLAADGDAQVGAWEAFEEVHWDFLRTIRDLYIITATGSGKPAFQGEFTSALLQRLNRLNANSEEIFLPLEGWLRNAFGSLSNKRHFIQRPSLYCHTRTREWTMKDLVKGGKEQPMVSKDDLDEAQKLLNQRREEVWSTENGIQFIMHAIYHNGWQALQRTEFKATDMDGNKQVQIITDDHVRLAIRNFLVDVGMGQFEEAKKQTRVSEESGQSSCKEIPATFGPQVSWRWRVEPMRSFVFLAGGVGPPVKQEQWANYSLSQLKPDTPRGLLQGLVQYAEAFATHYSTN